MPEVFGISQYIYKAAKSCTVMVLKKKLSLYKKDNLATILILYAIKYILVICMLALNMHPYKCVRSGNSIPNCLIWSGNSILNCLIRAARISHVCDSSVVWGSLAGVPSASPG